MKTLKLTALGLALIILLFPPVEWQPEFEYKTSDPGNVVVPEISNDFLLSLDNTGYREDKYGFKYFLEPNILYGFLALRLLVVGVLYLMVLQVVRK